MAGWWGWQLQEGQNRKVGFLSSGFAFVCLFDFVCGYIFQSSIPLTELQKTLAIHEVRQHLMFFVCLLFLPPPPSPTLLSLSLPTYLSISVSLCLCLCLSLSLCLLLSVCLCISLSLSLSVCLSLSVLKQRPTYIYKQEWSALLLQKGMYAKYRDAKKN